MELSKDRVPTRAVGRTQTSILQLGWWQAGGPPYFPMPDVKELVEVRRICAERGVTSDCAPAYGKGMSEMLMYVTYCYLEDEWRAAGLTNRKEGDSIFTKCGLWWPRDSRMGTHADMHRSPDIALHKKPLDVTDEEIEQLTLQGFEESCARLNVDYVHGFMLHWPLVKHGGRHPAMDWMSGGMLKAFAKLWKDGRVGSLGLANVDLEILEEVHGKAKQLAKGMGRAGKGFGIHYIQNDRSMLGIDVHGGPFHDRDLLNSKLADYCQEQGILRMAYSSLGHGPPIPPAGPFVYVDHWPESREQQEAMYNYRKEMHNRFSAQARKLGCSSPQMGLAWLMAHDLVPVFSATIPKFLIEDIDSVKFIDAVRSAEQEIEQLCEEYRQGLWAIIRKYRTRAKW